MSQPLKPLRIGPIEITLPVVLSALAGYSDLPFRRLCRRFGSGYCATEMLLDRSVLGSGKLRRRLLALTEDDHPVAGQLIGFRATTMARAAAALEASGFEVVDLNFACPVRKALRRGRGGALMAKPAQALDIVRAVIDAVDVPVTLKLRSGFIAGDDSREAFWRIADGAFEAGAAAICVHTRTVGAKYLGAANWELLAEIKRHFADRTIIGSGDVRLPADALRMLAETGVDGVAVARGALGNPWFFRDVGDLIAGRQFRPPALAEQREVLLWQYEGACELYGPRRASRIMRKHAIKYARVHPHPKRVRTAFAAVRSPDDWQAVLDECYV